MLTPEEEKHVSQVLTDYLTQLWDTCAQADCDPALFPPLPAAVLPGSVRQVERSPPFPPFPLKSKCGRKACADGNFFEKIFSKNP